MATWPATLPRPLAAGYQLAPADQTIRTDMEVGRARVRRRTHARADQIRVAWLFSAYQMEEFRAWYDNAAAGGAAWFNVPLDTGDGGTRSVQARFVGPWQAERLKGGVRWRVSALLEVR